MQAHAYNIHALHMHACMLEPKYEHVFLILIVKNTIKHISTSTTGIAAKFARSRKIKAILD